MVKQKNTKYIFVTIADMKKTATFASEIERDAVTKEKMVR